jgi:uncharacterized protein
VGQTVNDVHAVHLCDDLNLLKNYYLSNRNFKKMLAKSILNEIIDYLRPIDPEKVILFGSYAYGTPDSDSDIDLYIVTKENFIPASYEENLQIKKRVYMALSKFRKKYASDILVHTLPVHQKFIETGSSFSKEIMAKGIILI